MTSSRSFRLLVIGAMAAAGAYAAQGDGMGLQPGVLPPSWITGGPNCISVPDWQVHEYNEDFYILRESGCINYEKPFLYLIFGQDKAILEDTGAGSGVQTASFVTDLIAKWAKKKNRAPVPLIVIHSHGHGDHVAGDKAFQAMANVQFVAATPEEIQKAAGIAKWPTDLGKIDLGNRMLDIIPIPGHHTASIAIYDRLTGNLMTGDSLYPGRLYVPDDGWQDFAASARRLADFVLVHPIAHVLGTHIEQSRIAYSDYPTGTLYQPNEHILELTRAHVLELNQAFLTLQGKPGTVELPDFTVMARPARTPRPAQTAGAK
jgi:glyoxylase-like metal-dependent hydrolase (beta-lactamase superfamily II)